MVDFLLTRLRALLPSCPKITKEQVYRIPLVFCFDISFAIVLMCQICVSLRVCLFLVVPLVLLPFWFNWKVLVASLFRLLRFGLIFETLSYFCC